MNRNQWYVLSIASYLLAWLFSYISSQWKSFCYTGVQETFNTLQACVRGDIFAPYPYIFFTLGLVFLILAWLEPKKK